MTIITDSLGSWEQIGEIAVTDNWQLFDNPILNSKTFRLTFRTNWEIWGAYNTYQSYGLLRLYYPTAEVTVSNCMRLYVAQEHKILTLSFDPITDTFDIGVKRVIYAKSYYKAPINPDDSLTWYLKLEAKVIT
ncbi:hypothetical protein BZZ01_32455 [Nostocales cyanobacterium HT-58-2]|nr:hypothetical protein BZZ01_32455 [Nostocales cyanobacterium HT-58-2]